MASVQKAESIWPSATMPPTTWTPSPQPLKLKPTVHTAKLQACKGAPAPRPCQTPSSSHAMAWSKVSAWDPKLRSPGPAGLMESTQPMSADELNFALVLHQVHVSLERCGFLQPSLWDWVVWYFKGKAERSMPWNSTSRWASRTPRFAELETWTLSASHQQRTDGKPGNWLSVLTLHKSHSVVRRNSKWVMGRDYLGLAFPGCWEMVWRGPELWCKSAQLLWCLKRKIFGGSLWDTHQLVNIFWHINLCVMRFKTFITLTFSIPQGTLIWIWYALEKICQQCDVTKLVKCLA